MFLGDNQEPRLASENDLYSYIVLTRFFIFFVCLGGGQKLAVTFFFVIFSKLCYKSHNLSSKLIKIRDLKKF